LLIEFPEGRLNEVFRVKKALLIMLMALIPIVQSCSIFISAIMMKTTNWFIPLFIFLIVFHDIGKHFLRIYLSNADLSGAF